MLLLLALLACDDAPPPLAGPWQLVEKRIAHDGCAVVPPGREGDPCALTCEPVEISPTREGTFTIAFGEMGGAAACTGDPATACTCVVEDVRGPPEARIARRDLMEGRQTGPDELRGVFTLRMTCEGPGCAGLPQFAAGACETRGTWRAERR